MSLDKIAVDHSTDHRLISLLVQQEGSHKDQRMNRVHRERGNELEGRSYLQLVREDNRGVANIDPLVPEGRKGQSWGSRHVG